MAFEEKLCTIRKNKPSKLKLINTIEISPYDYANSEYECPNGSSKDLPEKWDEFWQKCLADKNLNRLKAVRKGSYLVDITSIGQEELKEIIKNELKEVDLTDYEEQIGRICGGIVINVKNEFPVEPTCCGDIGNIQEWESIFEEESKDWKQLWIGHPWVFYKKTGGKIEFSDYYEANVEDLKIIKTVLAIPVDELKGKLKILKDQQLEFENRIRIILQKMEIQNSEQIAKLMTGNE